MLFVNGMLYSFGFPDNPKTSNVRIRLAVNVLHNCKYSTALKPVIVKHLARISVTFLCKSIYPGIFFSLLQSTEISPLREDMPSNLKLFLFLGSLLTQSDRIIYEQTLGC